MPRLPKLIRVLFASVVVSYVSPLMGFDFSGGSDSCCDSSCDAMEGCDLGCSTGWVATVDAIFLHRDDPASAVLGFNTVDPTESLNAADFDFGTHTGFDVSLKRRLGCNLAWELRYFGVDQWTAHAGGSTTRNDLLQFNAEIPVFATAGDAISASYASELHNGEMNLRLTTSDWLDLIGGFRYLELNEFGQAGLVNAAVPFNYNVETNNRLYGAQLGAQAWLWSNEKFSLDAFAKAGIYGNHSSQDSLITSGVATSTALGDGNLTAFIGELGINGAVQLSDQFSIRGGYRMLWLDRVALASDQLATSDFFAGTGFNGRGDLFFHGASAGLVFTH